MPHLDAIAYPVLGAHFAVYFHGLLPAPIDMAFQSISGLEATIETEPYSSGGMNWADSFLPKSVKYTNLSLKRGLKDFPSPLAKWCEAAFEQFKFQPLDIVIVLMNEKHLPIKTWHVSKAIPVKYAFGEMNAETAAVFMENFELKYESFKVVQ